MTELTAKEKQKDIETKISIIERSVIIWTMETKSKYISNEHLESAEEHLKCELKKLEEMKEKYPEYFI